MGLDVLFVTSAVRIIGTVLILMGQNKETRFLDRNLVDKTIRDWPKKISAKNFWILCFCGNDRTNDMWYFIFLLFPEPKILNHKSMNLNHL
jgi:hypothetical protein